MTSNLSSNNVSEFSLVKSIVFMYVRVEQYEHFVLWTHTEFFYEYARGCAHMKNVKYIRTFSVLA